MQDWDRYIERPIVDVLPELAAEDFRVICDECAIAGFRNINIEKGDVSAEIVCVLVDEEWWVDDVFENGESYQESEK